MKIWLIQANEPIPFLDEKQRFFRTGMLAEELNSRKHEVTWFASTFDHYTKTQRFAENKSIKINEHFNIEMLWSPSYKKNISLKRIINHQIIAYNFRKIIKSKEKPDLIYCSFPTIELAVVAIKFGRKNKIKVIIDIRDLWPDIFFQNLKFPLNYLSYPYQFIMNIKTKRVLKNASSLNAISDEALLWGLKKININNKRKYDYSYFIGYKNQFKKTSNEFKNRNRISFIGTIGNQINYDFINKLGNAIDKKELPVKITICGDGPQFESFKKMVKNINCIELLGWVNSEQIKEVLNTSFIGLIPYNDTFDFQIGVGNKFSEVAAFSLPIIVTCTGAMQKLLYDYNSGICTKNIIEAVNYIEVLIQNQDKYKSISQNSRKMFDELLDSKNIYSNLVDYLEKILEE